MNTQNVLPIAPEERSEGWLNYNDKVVVITFENRIPIIKTGHVCSWPGSHGIGMKVDNIKETIVWGDEPWNTLSDSADDAYEKSFKPQEDHYLLKKEEAVALRDPQKACLWFARKHGEAEALKIAEALVNADLEHRPDALLVN